MIDIAQDVSQISYSEFARRIYETGVLSDPWVDGRERFRLRGLVLTTAQANALNTAAERVAYIHHELTQILLDDVALLDEFYKLTPWQRAMWAASGSLWHGSARADLFICTDGRIRCCELNSDTPSGQPEAVLLNRLLHKSHIEMHNSSVSDPNAQMGEHYVEMLRQSLAKRTDKPLQSVGIVYPTELTEDLGLIMILSRWLEDAGISAVVRGSPYNVRRSVRGIEVLGTSVDLIVRHYKTDWWGERVPVWADAPEFPDPDPLEEPLRSLLEAEMHDQVTVVNPFGSVVTQNKLSLAFCWEEQDRFSPQAQAWIRELIPETRRMTSVLHEQLRRERAAWVLKSDYGCEGWETVCGAFVTNEVWNKIIDKAVPEHFVAQRFFEVAPTPDGYLPNYGVYLIGGSASGYFTRLAHQSTGYTALTAPTFVAESHDT